MGVNVEVSRRESSKELLWPESMFKSFAFSQARLDDPLKNQEDRTIWLAKWEMSVRILIRNESIDYEHGPSPAVFCTVIFLRPER
jgi:hypothetical protein